MSKKPFFAPSFISLALAVLTLVGCALAITSPLFGSWSMRLNGNYTRVATFADTTYQMTVNATDGTNSVVATGEKGTYTHDGNAGTLTLTATDSFQASSGWTSLSTPKIRRLRYSITGSALTIEALTFTKM
ncbi:MAG TPA: hypothetical protein PKO22_12410 [Treponemataceae bacterium]|nr:hypothetical protein [Treponemataceae bacterium]